jgi:hypothetical protein
MRRVSLTLATGLALAISALMAAPASAASTSAYSQAHLPPGTNVSQTLIGKGIRPAIAFNGQQLRFLDYQARVYSITITGVNQDGVGAQDRCVYTPSFQTDVSNWWWVGRTYVDLYTGARCGGSHIGQLWFDAATAWNGHDWRCLSDHRPDFPDYDC